ncbi:hypothetical protein L1987_19182 [Smallanthus sonchifolius]|uniref:Uncharacterized protein n=1 Tax=Smallanthus sonchifolius TaxID=185202 RepID=A0ACB9IND0_9ASTR|nr:hypothetical protein L1987_19182 [Smallanthus sonchifolius]
MALLSDSDSSGSPGVQALYTDGGNSSCSMNESGGVGASLSGEALVSSGMWEGKPKHAESEGVSVTHSPGMHGHVPPEGLDHVSEGVQVDQGTELDPGITSEVGMHVTSESDGLGAPMQTHEVRGNLEVNSEDLTVSISTEDGREMAMQTPQFEVTPEVIGILKTNEVVTNVAVDNDRDGMDVNKPGETAFSSHLFSLVSMPRKKDPPPSALPTRRSTRGVSKPASTAEGEDAEALVGLEVSHEGSCSSNPPPLSVLDPEFCNMNKEFSAIPSVMVSLDASEHHMNMGNQSGSGKRSTGDGGTLAGITGVAGTTGLAGKRDLGSSGSLAELGYAGKTLATPPVTPLFSPEFKAMILARTSVFKPREHSGGVIKSGQSLWGGMASSQELSDGFGATNMQGDEDLSRPHINSEGLVTDSPELHVSSDVQAHVEVENLGNHMHDILGHVHTNEGKEQGSSLDGHVQSDRGRCMCKLIGQVNQEQRFEEKRYVLDKLVPLESVLTGWPKPQIQYFRQLCCVYNFGLGYLAINRESGNDLSDIDMRMDADNVEEAESETDGAAVMMKSDSPLDSNIGRSSMNDKDPLVPNQLEVDMLHAACAVLLNLILLLLKLGKSVIRYLKNGSGLPIWHTAALDSYYCWVGSENDGSYGDRAK